MGQYIGIDLAWSNRARTGLATVSSNGRLTDSATVTTDAEIASWVAAVAPEVVAIDAPLVVPNETGQRACERLITSAFGRYHAGAHTSNRSRPYFNPPRAELLARDAGWAVDPEAAGPNRCIEVAWPYCHPRDVRLDQFRAEAAARRAQSIMRSLHVQHGVQPIVVVWGGQQGRMTGPSRPQGDTLFLPGRDLKTWLRAQSEGDVIGKAGGRDVASQLRRFRHRVRPD